MTDAKKEADLLLLSLDPNYTLARNEALFRRHDEQQA